MSRKFIFAWKFWKCCVDLFNVMGVFTLHAYYRNTYTYNINGEDLLII